MNSKFLDLSPILEREILDLNPILGICYLDLNPIFELGLTRSEPYI